MSTPGGEEVKTLKTLLLFSLFLTLLTTPANGAEVPPWFKNGTYVTYVVFSSEDREGLNELFPFMGLMPDQARNTLLEKLRSRNCTDEEDVILNPDYLGDLIVTDKILVTFTLTNVTNTSAWVEVELELHNTTIPWCNIGNVTFTTALLLNLTDGYYYLNGTRIGRPSFFVLPHYLPDRRDLIFKSSLLKSHGFSTDDLIVGNVSFRSKKLVHTFVKTFQPPVIEVRSNQPPIAYSREGGGYLSGSLMYEGLYDIDTGIVLGIRDIPYPEFYALGIIGGLVHNVYSAEKNDELDFSREYWPYGFVLYQTNIEFPKEESGVKPDSILKYYLLIGILTLITSTIWRWRK